VILSPIFSSSLLYITLYAITTHHSRLSHYQ
jgi:hypothetical protein